MGRKTYGDEPGACHAKMDNSFLISYQLPTVLLPVQIRFSCYSLRSISSFFVAINVARARGEGLQTIHYVDRDGFTVEMEKLDGGNQA
jgi:hypothetical protein